MELLWITAATCVMVAASIVLIEIYEWRVKDE